MLPLTSNPWLSNNPAQVSFMVTKVRWFVEVFLIGLAYESLSQEMKPFFSPKRGSWPQAFHTYKIKTAH